MPHSHTSPASLQFLPFPFVLRVAVVLVLIVLGTDSSDKSAQAQSRERPGRLPSEVRAALLPGLQIEFPRSTVEHDVRTSRLMAYYAPEGQITSPFLDGKNGIAELRMRGYLKLRLRGTYSFALLGEGKLSLSINDKDVVTSTGVWDRSKPIDVEMVKGYNKLQLTYASLQSSTPKFRVYWKGDDFDWEPIPPTVLWHNSETPEMKHGMGIRQGRLLFAKHNCSKCHTLPLEKSELAMAELHRDAPALTGVAKRLSATWIKTWIVDPASVRNQTTMPTVFGHLPEEQAQQTAADIATYLTQDTSTESSTFQSNPELTKAGETLFEERGCIGCHRFSAPNEEDEFRRISLHYVAAKFKPGALTQFLTNTHQHYQWSRMPKFPLSDKECAALEHYVRKESKGEVAESAVVGDVARGQAAFATLGCANCHSIEGKEFKQIQAPKLSRSDQGCLSSGSTKRRVDYHWEDENIQQLRSFLATGFDSLKNHVPVEFAQRQWQNMKCRTCHTRDGEDSDLPYVVIEDGSGKVPDAIPNLTWAGEKLQTDWTARLFSGKLTYRPRPHFRTRMPALPARGSILATALSWEHGFAADENERPQTNKDLVETGAAVAAMTTGLACHRCHAIGDKQATAPFEARSTNLSFAAERLRYDFYHRWMRDPIRIDRQTKMIKFAPDGKKTGLDKIYDGDARQQFEAVWHYLQELNSQERKQ